MEYPTWFDRTPAPNRSFLSQYPRVLGYQDSMAWNSAHDPAVDAKQGWLAYALKDAQGRWLWNTGEPGRASTAVRPTRRTQASIWESARP